MAEKTRAIYERQGRARDIYDIVNISRNFREHINIDIARSGLHKKFSFKSLPEPSVDLIFSQIDLAQLKAGWEDQLAHQLEVLPPAESFYNDLKHALSWWIDNQPTEPVLSTISQASNEISLPRVHFPHVQTIQSRRLSLESSTNPTFFKHMDQIRYAARNRLCLEISYHGVRCLIEPYSLRQPRSGNQLLYGYELLRESSKINMIKSYKINDIKSAEVKQQAFSPRYVVEL